MKNNIEKNPASFAFLVHSRDLTDIKRKFKFAKFLPKFILAFFAKNMWPVIASRVTGFKDKNGLNVRGYFLAFPMTADQMLKNKDLAKKKIIQSLKLAEKLDIKIIGLGAFTSSITNGGIDLIKENINIGITTGNSLTAGITILAFEKILKLKNIDIKKDKVAVVGATGSIGSAVAKYLIKLNVGEIVLIGKTNEHLKELEKELNNISKKYNSKTVYTISNDIHKIKYTKVVIVTTSAVGATIKSEYLRKNAIIYDITQPKNVNKDLLKKRNDITIIDGGQIYTPGIDYHFNFGYPREVAFSCLAETMILAGEYKYENYSLGKVKLDNMEEMISLLKKYNFSPL